MSAQILPFDRARVLHRGLNLDEARRRVRMGARAAGCTVDEIETAQRYAVRLWIDCALDPHFVIERATAFAKDLAAIRSEQAQPA